MTSELGDKISTAEPCSSCGGRGHVVELWTGEYWLTCRGCNACGMHGEASEFANENRAARGGLSC